MEELNETPVTPIVVKLGKVKLSELTAEEQDIYNWTKVVPIDRVCAMYGVHKETVEGILNKVK